MITDEITRMAYYPNNKIYCLSLLKTKMFVSYLLLFAVTVIIVVLPVVIIISILNGN
jgi:hypothetical protein